MTCRVPLREEGPGWSGHGRRITGRLRVKVTVRWDGGAGRAGSQEPGRSQAGGCELQHQASGGHGTRPLNEGRTGQEGHRGIQRLRAGRSTPAPLKKQRPLPLGGLGLSLPSTVCRAFLLVVLSSRAFAPGEVAACG